MDIKKNRKIILAAFLITFIIYLPFIINPDFFYNRNNDLQNYNKPLFSIFKGAFEKSRSIPLWQNILLSGYPLLGDPQSIIMYPFNYLSLLIDVDYYFLIYFLFHSSLGILGVYYLCRRCLSFPRSGAFLAGIFYILSAKLFAHVEAGHTNLFASYAYVPWAILAFILFIKKANLKTSIFLGLSLSLIYLLYLTTFYYLVLFLIVLGIYHKSYIDFKKNRLMFFGLLAILSFLGFSLPELLASYELWPNLTRNLLTFEDVAGLPLAWRQYLGQIFNPLTVIHVQTEGVIYVSFFLLILSILGFKTLKLKFKILIFTLFTFIFLYSVGSKTEVYKFLYNYFPGIKLFRVQTRIWFIVTLGISILGAKGFANLYQKKKNMALFLAICAVVEVLIFSFLRFKLQQSKVISPVPTQLYKNIFENEKDFFRIYCTNECIHFDTARRYNIGFIGGYTPVQLSNYFYFFQKAAGFNFSSYAISLPPYQVLVDQPQPKAYYIGLLGVRYIISSYSLSDHNFSLLNKEGSFNLYKNNLEKPRVYLLDNENNEVPLNITYEHPGFIEIAINNLKGRVIINEIYAKGWKVYKDSIRENAVEYEGVLLSTNISQETKKIVFKYEPLFTPYSWYILIFTYLVALFILLRKN